MARVNSFATSPEARMRVPLGSAISRLASRSLASDARLAMPAACSGIGGMKGQSSAFGLRLLDPRATIHLRSTQADSPWVAQ